MEDFFVSYNKADKSWAVGLGDWLDHAGFTVILQEQDFVGGANFVSEMHRALKVSQRLIMVLSPDYLSSKFAESEWTSAFASDPTNEKRTLIPVRVRECQPDGLLRPIVCIDLVGLSVEQARDRFISEIMATLEGRRNVSTSTAAPAPDTKQATIKQVAVGKKITQVAGDYHHYEKPPKQNIIITPPVGAVSLAELKQIQSWIENLAENTVGKPRHSAFGMWRNRFKNNFGLIKSEQLLSAQLPEAESWYHQQLAILKRGLKTKAPDAWRKERYKAIHMAMQQMGVDKLTYYSEIARRLKMKKLFTSLTDLTKRDLERAYTMVLRDARER
jgi:TIR domain